MMEAISKNELLNLNGGWLVPFIAGAILGGMVYDLYKTMCKEIIEAQIDHPEWYEGIPHGR